MPTFILSLCLFTLLVLCSYLKQLIAKRGNHLPPGPWPLPVIGNLLDIRRDPPHRSLACLAQRHGSVMTVRLGGSTVIVISSASAAREILQTHKARVSGGTWTDAWQHGAGHAAESIFSIQPHRKRQALRRLGAEQLFSPRSLDGLLQQREDVVHDLLRSISEHGASGAPVSIGRVTFSAMVTLLWRFMFTADLDEAVRHEIEDWVREAVVLISAPNVSDFFPAIARADVQGLRGRMSRVIRKLGNLVDQQIVKRTCILECNNGAGTRTHDLLDAMLDMAEQGQGDNGLTMNRDVMRGFCVDLLAGASDTTSSTIEWAIAELLQNPHTLTKLQEELKLVLGSKTQVEDLDIGQLPYLHAVIMETLRIHSVLPLLSYRADTTIQVQGYSIPEGSKILVNLWAIHHDAQYWRDPDVFIPERFLHKDSDLFGRDFQFIPFGSGRRMCLGLPLANRMLPLMLGSLVHQFDWTLPKEVGTNGINMTEKFGLVVSMANPIHAIARRK